MWRIMTVAAAAALVALATTGAPARTEDECDAVTKRALREFKSALDRRQERWDEVQGIENGSDPVIMQLCSFYKVFPPTSRPGDGAKD